MPAAPKSSLALLALLAVGSLPCAACIINVTDDVASTTSDDGTPPTTGLPSDSTGPATSVSTTSPTGLDTTGTTGVDDTDGTTTGGPMGDCTENLLGDPGFEAGTPNPAWDEASLVFDAVICDASCTDEPGAEPYAGDWWVWLGGVDDEPEVGSVSQTVVIEPETAYLGFRFQIRSAAGTGDDLFTVTIDDVSVFMVTDAQMAEYDAYTQVYVDVSTWADGGEHELTFTGDLLGNGLTSFFVDETSLVSCVEPSATDSGTESSGSGSGTGTGTGSSGTGSSGGT